MACETRISTKHVLCESFDYCYPLGDYSFTLDCNTREISFYTGPVCVELGLMVGVNQCYLAPDEETSFILEEETNEFCFQIWNLDCSVLQSQSNVTCGWTGDLLLDCDLDTYYYQGNGPQFFSVCNPYIGISTIVNPLPCVYGG